MPKLREMKGAFHRGNNAIVAISFVAALVGCGGSSSPTGTPAPAPVPTPPPPAVVDSGQWQGIPPNSAGIHPLDISSTRTIEAVVNYTHDDTQLNVYIARGTCSFDQFVTDQCEFVATSSGDGNPRRVSAANQPAGSYTLIIWNVGPREESIAYQVIFTAQATATGKV